MNSLLEQVRVTSFAPIADRAGVYQLTFASDSRLAWDFTLEAIKKLPKAQRRYQPEAKCWEITATGLSRLARDWPDLRHHVVAANITISRPKSKQPPERAEEAVGARVRARGGRLPVWMPPSTVEAYDALYLHPEAPPEVVKASYRALAKMTHPDTGGETEAMKHINESYSLALDWSERHNAVIPAK